jgi:succinate dehydrogenase / fumarate reductase iron-sulfur subunit
MCSSLSEWFGNVLYISKNRSLGSLPQGEVEADKRAQAMVAQMDKEGFGMCSNIGACEAECPKEIKLENIAFMNRSYFKAVFSGD